MRDCLEDFQRQLGITDDVRDQILHHLSASQVPEGSRGKSLKVSSRIDWRFEWHRVRLSWARKELDQSIKEIDRLNKKLNDLLSDSEKVNLLEQERSVRTSSSSIQRLRNHATVLYYFLSKQWPCSCDASHSARNFLRHKPAVSEKGPQSKGLGVTGAAFELSMAVEGLDGSKHFWQGPLACTLEEDRLAQSSKTHHVAVTEHNVAQSLTHRKTEKHSVWKKSLKFRDVETTPISTESQSSLLTRQFTPASGPILESHTFCVNLKSIHDSSECKIGPFIEGNGFPLHLICYLRLENASRIVLSPLLTRTLGQTRLLMLSTQHRTSDHETTPPTISLREALSQGTTTAASFAEGPTSLSLSERIKLAVDLASSFFYIFGTPWYRQGWSKEDVKLSLETKTFQRRQRAALLERRFPDKGKEQNILSQDPQDAFGRLGICLEELCFGKPLESLRAYDSFCGPDGKPHSWTSRIVAQEMLDEVRDQLGFCYFDAVKKCLGLSLIVNRSNCGEPGFWQKAHDDVVEPLRKVLQVWVSQDLTSSYLELPCL